MDGSLTKIGKNTVWHLIGKGVSTVLSIILVFLIAKFLGPDNYGTFSLAITFLFLFQQLTSLGLEQSLPYFIQKYLGQSRNLLKKYFRVRVLITLLGAIIFYFLADFIAGYYNNPPIAHYLRLIALFIPFFILMNASYQIFQGFNDLKQSMKVDVVFSTTKFLALALILLGFGVAGSIIGYGISYIITTVFAYLIICHRFLKRGREFKKVKSFARYAGTTFMVGVFTFLANYLINLYLGFNPSELGFFDSANKVGLFVSLVPVALSTSLLPSITSKSKKKIKAIVNRLLKYYLVCLLPVIIILLSIPNFIVNLLLSADYSVITSFLWIIVIALAVNTLVTIYNAVSYGIGKPQYVLVGFIIKTAVIFSFSYYLTSAFNASIVFLLSIIASTIITSLLLSDYINHPLSAYAKSLLSAVPLILVLFFDYCLYFKIAASLLALFIYLMVNYYYVLDQDDRELLGKFLTKVRRTI